MRYGQSQLEVIACGRAGKKPEFFSELPHGSYCLLGVSRSLGLVFVWGDVSEKDLEGPTWRASDLENGESYQDDKASGLFLPQSSPSAQFYRDPAGGFPKSERVKVTSWTTAKVMGGFFSWLLSLDFISNTLDSHSACLQEYQLHVQLPASGMPLFFPSAYRTSTFPLVFGSELLFDLVPTSIALLKATCNC